MTAIICAIALSVVPAVSDCQRGGHAKHHPWMERGDRAALVLEDVGSVPTWVCIHNHEGAWNDTGDPYWGGLQMDRGFMATYGPDFIRAHAGEGSGGEGLADSWTPREQMVAAHRAWLTRGYGPWPRTRIPCHV